MTSQSVPCLRIEVALHASTGFTATAEEAERFSSRLSSRLVAWLGGVGLPGEPAIRLQPGAGTRAVQLRVHDVVMPFPPDLLRQVWELIAPASLRSLPLEPPSEGEEAPAHPFPDAWFRSYLEAVQTFGDTDGRRLVFAFLERLCFEIIRARPARLVDSAVAAAYLGPSPHSPQPETTLERSAALLRGLLELGVSVVRRDFILERIELSRSLDEPWEETLEGLFGQLCSDRIEVRLGIELFALLVPGPTSSTVNLSPFQWLQRGGRTQPASHLQPVNVAAPEVEERFRDELVPFMEDGLFTELGIVLPEIFLVQDARLPGTGVSVRVHDLETAPLTGPGPHELLIQPLFGNVNPVFLGGKPTLNPASEVPAAIVPDHARDRFDESTYQIWNPADTVIAILTRQLRLNAFRLIGIDWMSWQLDHVSSAFPELASTAVSLLGVTRIVQVLRQLLREEVSCRDLHAHLNLLLDAFTGAGKSAAATLGEVPEGLRDRLTSPHNEALAEIARRSRSRAILAAKDAGPNAARGWYIDPELQARLDAWAVGQEGNRLSCEKQETLRDSLWKGMAGTVDPAPLVLASATSRVVIREILAGEFPRIKVYPRESLPGDLQIVRAGDLAI